MIGQEAGREAIERENQKLKAELARLQAELARHRTTHKVTRWIGSRAIRAVVGWNLTERIAAWIDAYRKVRPEIPLEETAAVLEGVLHRVIRVGLWTLAVGVVPIVLLFWQNLLIRDQNLYFREQIAEMRKQDRTARRAELIATIYDENCDVSLHLVRGGRARCAMKASKRAREEAIKAFVALERLRGASHIDLTNVRLDELQLQGVDLSGVDLERAVGQQCDLTGADLTGANMGYATFDGATLTDATLAGANLVGTQLLGARLNGADLTGARYDPVSTTWPPDIDPVARGAVQVRARR